MDKDSTTPKKGQKRETATAPAAQSRETAEAPAAEVKIAPAATEPVTAEPQPDAVTIPETPYHPEPNSGARVDPNLRVTEGGQILTSADEQTGDEK